MTVPPPHRWAQTSSCSCGRSPFSSAADPSLPSSSFPEPVSQTSAVRALWWNHAIGSVSAGACGAKPVKHQSQNKGCLLLKLQVYAKVVIKSGHGTTSLNVTHLSVRALICFWSLFRCISASSVLSRRSSISISICSLARQVFSSICICRASTCQTSWLQPSSESPRQPFQRGGAKANL